MACAEPGLSRKCQGCRLVRSDGFRAFAVFGLHTLHVEINVILYIYNYWRLCGTRNAKCEVRSVKKLWCFVWFGYHLQLLVFFSLILVDLLRTESVFFEGIPVASTCPWRVLLGVVAPYPGGTADPWSQLCPTQYHQVGWGRQWSAMGKRLNVGTAVGALALAPLQLALRLRKLGT